MSSSVRIGWAGRDITPRRPVLLRGQFNMRIATRARDPLTLTAMAIESDGEQAVFVSVDNCGVERFHPRRNPAAPNRAASGVRSAQADRGWNPHPHRALSGGQRWPAG